MPTATIWVPALVVAHVMAAIWASCTRWFNRQRQTRPPAQDSAGYPMKYSAADSPCNQTMAAPLLLWHNVSVSVPVPRQGVLVVQDCPASKALLANVSGSLEPGHLDLLLGPSGSGKSTLLDQLAGKALPSGKSVVTGSISTGSKSDPTQVCYVPQHDLFLPSLTTWDTLCFVYSISEAAGPGTAYTRSSSTVRDFQIAQVLQLMGLQHCRDTQVGGVMPGGQMLRGLSGGERKRLAIAASLVSLPDAMKALDADGGVRPSALEGAASCAPLVLLCDEPTSGLDSWCALSVMRILRQLTETNAGVLAALHQPRPAIWQLIDHVSVLVCGQLLYWGPAEQMVPWLCRVPSWGQYQPTLHGSEPDFVLEAVCSAQHAPSSPDSDPTAITARESGCVQAAAAAFHQCLLRHGLVWWHQPCSQDAPAVKPTPATWDLPALNAKVPPGTSISHAVNEMHLTLPSPREQEALTPSINYLMKHSLEDSHGRHTSSAHIQLVATHTGDIHIRTSMQLVSHPTSASCTAVSQAARAWRAVVDWFSHVLTWCWEHHRATVRQAALLTWREYAQLRADSFGPPLKLLMFTWSAFVMGMVFYGTDQSSGITRLQLLASSTFMGCSVLLSMPYMSLLAFTADQAHSSREAHSGCYGCVPRFVSKLLATLPLHLLCAASYTVTLYGMLGFRPQLLALLQNMLLSVLLMLCAAQVMHVSVVACTSSDTAFMITTCWAVVNMFFSGFLVHPDQLALSWLAPLRHLSALRLTYHGILRVQLQGTVLPCGTPQQMQEEALTFLATAQGRAELPPSSQSFVRAAGALLSLVQVHDVAEHGACLLNGDAVLQGLGVGGTVPQLLGGLLAYWGGLGLLTLAVQAYRWPRRQPRR